MGQATSRPPGAVQARLGQPDSGSCCSSHQPGTPGDHNKPPDGRRQLKIPQGRGIPPPDPAAASDSHCGPASSAHAVLRADPRAPMCSGTGRFQRAAAAREPQGSGSRC
ncbi:hypothetical protein NDU88_004544 [Pleurodeles waltl]|uniref:Uncharacterized protein n=1 Tax=Pleurodeles waltl TaxID=8319 RepID=A0AAV7T8F9_PLEWA|nr:hypothetical protein NDU88_004544 [Pleurodeles waltl]